MEVGADLYCVRFDIRMDFYRENYGADADGRRGEMRSYVEREVADVPSRVELYTENDCVEVAWASLTPEVQTAIKTQMEAIGEDYEPDDYGPEDDGDAAYDAWRDREDD